MAVTPWVASSWLHGAFFAKAEPDSLTHDPRSPGNPLQSDCRQRAHENSHSGLTITGLLALLSRVLSISESRCKDPR